MKSGILVFIGVLLVVVSLITLIALPKEEKIVNCYDRSGNIIVGADCLRISFEAGEPIENILMGAAILGMFLTMAGMFMEVYNGY